MPSRPRVVIIGAGFAGLHCAMNLPKSVQLTVIDRSNHHLFQPLLYQVATAGLSPADISAPIRSLLSKRDHIRTIMGNVDEIDSEKKVVQLDSGEVIGFDYLLIASGARHSYFGNEAWEKWAPGLKTLDDALDIRRRVLLAFEEAEQEKDHGRRNELLTFVIVGGGPTGIEMAGAIAELARFALARDFTNINPTLANIILVDAGPRLLATFSEKTGEAAYQALKELGVQVISNKRVTNIDHDGVQVEDEFIPTHTVIWAAGVRASSLGNKISKMTDQMGRVLVRDDLSIQEFPHIFVAGDLAAVKHGAGWVPGVAPAAIQEGRHVAESIKRLINNKSTESFSYKDKGAIATIGRSKAVVEIGHFHLFGHLAWVFWLLIHIYYLIGFRNRLIVLIQWAWSYFTFKRGTRLITGSRRRHIEPHHSTTELG